MTAVVLRRRPRWCAKLAYVVVLALFAAWGFQDIPLEDTSLLYVSKDDHEKSVEPKFELRQEDTTKTFLNRSIDREAELRVMERLRAKKRPPTLPEHPLLAHNRSLPVVSVLAWPLVDQGAQTAVQMHLQENGIAESPFLRMAGPDDTDYVWLADIGGNTPWKVWCDMLLERVQKTPASYRPVVFIVDLTDHPAVARCPKVEATVGADHVFYSTRSVAVDRHWDQDWVDPGRRLPLSNLRGVSYQHTPLYVRTDIVEELERILLEEYNATLMDPMERLERSCDVSHFGPSMDKP